MTYDELKKELQDFYGTATDLFPAAWGDVISVDHADKNELIQMAKEAGIDTSHLEEK